MSGPRQLVVLADGTNNNLTGGVDDTNLVKLAELLAKDRRDAAERLVFYDPGVGNPGELPGATNIDKLKRKLDRISGLAFGVGVYENISECYRFLMEHWQPGDELWIFGFSRGAFTARSLAGLVNRFGILDPKHENMIPTLLHVYFSDFSDKEVRGLNGELPSVRDQWASITEQTTRLFAAPAGRRVPIHFVGVWDTVTAVGLGGFGLRITQLPTPHNKQFVHIRQALALDEHRLQFLPRLYAHDNGTFLTVDKKTGSIRQLWFPGAHCDVGGGYSRAASAGSDRALAWLVSEAVQLGLRLAHDGQPLASETAVIAALEAQELRTSPGPEAVLHSQLRLSPFYALTGMGVRDTTKVVMDNGTAYPLRAEAHVSAPPCEPRLPSAWVGYKVPALNWYLLFAAAMLMMAMGQLQHGWKESDQVWRDLALSFQQIPAYLHKNLEFQLWQLTGWLNWGLLDGWPADPWRLGALFNGDWSDDFSRFAHPAWATWLDFAFIACYALGLSALAARAFGRLAGVRQAGDAADPALNRLGAALMRLLAFDLKENAATLLALFLGTIGFVGLAWLAQLLVARYSVLKLIALWWLLVLLMRGSLEIGPSPAGGLPKTPSGS